MAFGHALPLRLARGVAAFFLADLITGLAAFCVITSGALWYFCLSWIQLQGEYARIGGSFGSPWQLDLAWFGLFACLGPLVASVYLARGAYKLPRALIH
jgi:hypothetical protein